MVSPLSVWEGAGAEFMLSAGPAGVGEACSAPPPPQPLLQVEVGIAAARLLVTWGTAVAADSALSAGSVG